MLADLPAPVERGLHFNLTERAPPSPALRLHWPRLPARLGLIVMAHLGRLPLQASSSSATPETSSRRARACVFGPSVATSRGDATSRH
jgi:hypothetical protein